MRLHLFYIAKCDTANKENIEELFSAWEIALFEQCFYYMEKISDSIKIGDIVNIIAKFINAESLSNRDKAEIAQFRL